MPQTDDAVFYQRYFQPPGVAEADFEGDARAFLRGVLFSNSGDGPLREHGLPKDVGIVPRKGGMRARMATHMVTPEVLPPWLTEADVDFYAAEFGRTGFRGGLNW